MRFLNNKELKKIIGKENIKKMSEYAFAEHDDFIFVISRDIAKINLNDFNIRKVGLCIGRYDKAELNLNDSGERFFRTKRISFS